MNIKLTHVIGKLHKTEWRKNSWKKSDKEMMYHLWGTMKLMVADFSSETVVARRQWHDIFTVHWKNQYKILNPGKNKFEGKTDIFR